MMRFISVLLLGLCGVCSRVAVLGLSVWLSWYLCCECGCCGDCDACTVVCVACVCCEGARVTPMLVWGPGEVWLRSECIWVVHVVPVFCLVQVTCLR